MDAGETPYQCKQCGGQFSQSGYFIDHMRMHPEEKEPRSPRRCVISGQTGHHIVGDRDGFDRKRTQTGGPRLEEKSYQCKQCGKKFSQSCSLKVHMRLHTGEKPYQCKQCGKNFSRLDSLKEHLRVHTREKPYQCQHCRTKFAHSSSLKVHLRVHTREKPYQCKQCQKKFSRPDHLKVHMRVHTREKPYQCQQCGKKFAQSGQLTRHIALHTGKQAYQCKRCGRKYSQAKALTVHMKTHTGHQYVCEQCGKGFHFSSRMRQNEDLIARKHIESALPAKFIEDSVFCLQAIQFSGFCSSSVVLSILNHPNIAVTYGVTVSTCGSMLVMENVITCLSHLLAELGDELTVHERVNICYGIVCAVDYLHHHIEIVHGYINVDNVFITSQFTAKLFDPSAAYLMHDKMCRRVESFTDDLHHLICLLIAMLYNKHPTFIYACDCLRDMISIYSGEIRKEREDCISTSELLQILDELRDSEQYRNCSRNHELSWKD